LERRHEQCTQHGAHRLEKGTVEEGSASEACKRKEAGEKYMSTTELEAIDIQEAKDIALRISRGVNGSVETAY
jgi:hypothetical protein